VMRRSQNCCVGIRYCVIDEKGKSGAGKAEGDIEGVIAPGGTWWRTREPIDVSYVYKSKDIMYLSRDGSACRRWL
jgi:hypothetical protein